MRKALVVGINNYPLSPLKGCVNDAEAIHRLLQKNGNKSKNFNATLVKDVLLKSKLKGHIIKLFRTKCDVALFYFSGHGYRDRYGFHLVTPDCMPNDMGVSMADLMNIINASPVKNKVIILDCCHSGSAANYRYINNEENTVILGNGITILTSCGGYQKAISVNGHAVFTNLLMEALEGGSADLSGNITPGSIYAFIDKALGPKQQRPEFKTNISEFVVLRRVVPPIEPNILKNIISFFPEPSADFPLNPSFEDTNNPHKKPLLKKPFSNNENTVVFKQLQAMTRVGLVKPVKAEHMYYAAMKSKSCRLTPLGQHYWRLMKGGRT
jgi:hypothetical protein